jgi:hypothetical protein
MATAKSGKTALLAIGGGIVGLLVVMKLFPAKGVQAAGSSGSAGGGAYYPYPQAGTATNMNQTNGLLSSILNALRGQSNSGSGGAPKSSLSSGAGNPAQAIAGGGPMSIAQALAGGYYTGANENTLAGIFNIQQGAGDFAGDSAYSVGQSFLDSGMGLGDLLSSQDNQLGYQDSSQLLDLSAVASSIYGPSDYADTTYSNLMDSPSIDFSTPADVGNLGMSSADWGGGGGDLFSGDQGSGGGDISSGDMMDTA